MKIEKLHLSKEKIDLNLKFYFFLKLLNKLKPTNNQLILIIENIILSSNNIDFFINNLEKLFAKSYEKNRYFKEILSKINSSYDLDLFDFSLRLFQIKDSLLAESKIFETIEADKLAKFHPLSLEYDKITILKPYNTRVSGALLTLLFFEKLEANQFNFITKESVNFIIDLSKKAKKFKKLGLESNQIFMLMFGESINQSIISESGSNYEDRIKLVLNKIGITDIKKMHDENDKSTEYDFFFKIDNKSYGIGAKRTLRERYKQFIKTSLTSKIDVSIDITTGIDLNEEKAKIIISHGSYVFVSDEVYQSSSFMQENDKIFSVNSLNLETLKNLRPLIMI